MNPDIQAYVEGLFKGYERTAEMQDFIEEIKINMLEQIRDLIASGISSEEAFTKVVTRLGDITKVADDISRQKQTGVIGNMYIDNHIEVGKKHALGYAIAGGILLFGIIIAFITFSTTNSVFSGISSYMPFTVLSVTGFVFLGLTQETKRNYPMSWKRALVYALAVGSITFGVMVASMEYFMNPTNLKLIFEPLIPFVIPQAALIGFLILTEKKRIKHRAIEEQQIIAENDATRYSDPNFAIKRGILSGALWIAAFGGFALTWMTIGLKYAFFVFVLATILEMFIELSAHSNSFVKMGLLSSALWIAAFGGFALIWMTIGLKYAFFILVLALILEMFIIYRTYSKP